MTMRVVRPYAGPNSYDLRRDGDIVTAMVGCFDPATPLTVAIDFYADLLNTLKGPREQLIVQIQTPWIHRLRDKRRARGLGVLHAGKGWLALVVTPTHDLRALAQEFWRDKELRFYSVPASASMDDLPLERWYRSYIEDYQRDDFVRTHFVADEVWCDGYLILRSALLTEEIVLEAIRGLANQRQLHFVFNREPFAGQARETQSRGLKQGHSL